MRMAAPSSEVTIASTRGQPKPHVKRTRIAPSRPRLNLSVPSRATSKRISAHRIGRMGRQSYRMSTRRAIRTLLGPRTLGSASCVRKPRGVSYGDTGLKGRPAEPRIPDPLIVARVRRGLVTSGVISTRPWFHLNPYAPGHREASMACCVVRDALFAGSAGWRRRPGAARADRWITHPRTNTARPDQPGVRGGPRLAADRVGADRSAGGCARGSIG